MDAIVEKFYNDILADGRVDSEESAHLSAFFAKLNPPPDKLVWLRASAFRLGCAHLADTKEKNEYLLRAISAIVHWLEKNCMTPRNKAGNSVFDPEKAEALIRDIYKDGVVDEHENQELFQYFQNNIPDVGHLVPLRRTAFTVAIEYLSDNDTDHNTKLFRCINFVINAFEKSCFVPRTYEVKLEPRMSLDCSLEKAAQHLWDLDANRLTPDADYGINVQGGKKPYWSEDKAKDPLFKYVEEEAFRRPTYRTFIRLFDNYTAEVGKAERVTSSERREEKAFLDAIMETAPMQFCHKYLHKQNPSKVPASKDSFKKLLMEIWFELYRRTSGGPKDSSGFEHVFVGEIKNNKITGFHNWIRFYLEEKKGNLDYRGYIKPKARGDAATDSNDALLTLQFFWRGVEKSVGTSFIGTSPEFEMALFTMCFLLGQEDNEITLKTGTDEFVLNIKCYTFARDKVGTAYPEALEHHD